MASFVSSGWASGATVNAYAQDAYGQQTGSSVASATAGSSGQVTLSGLADATKYVASDGTRKVRFQTGVRVGAYRMLVTAKGKFDAVAAVTTLINEGGVNAPGGSGGGLNVVHLDPADLPSGALLRMKALVVTNATAPAANFTVGLYPITAPAGAAAIVTVTQGAVVAGSAAAVNAPGAGVLAEAVSGDFAVPAAGYYAIGVVVSATMAANSSAVVRGTLDAHY